MTIRTSMLAFLVALVATTTANANTYTIYKTVGANGEVKYMQIQPNPGVKYETIQFRDDGRQNTPGNMAAPTADPNVTADQNRIAELERQMKEQQDREKSERCQRLRQNLANLNMGGRIYETQPDGSRAFLNDQQINERRTRAQQTISQHCSG